MKKSPRQLILIIVEGKSEIDALEYPLNSLYEKYGYDVEIRFPVLDSDKDLSLRGGDITSERNVTPKNIAKRICSDIIDPFLLNMAPNGGGTFLSIDEVIQIVDLDGTFIEPCHVHEDCSLEKTMYFSDGIYARNAELICKRNTQKKENLEYLMSLDTLSVHGKRVPYSVYFFSSNLDHFFSDNANLEYHKKREKPSEFGTYYADPEMFVPYFQQESISLQSMTYLDSWAWATQGLNSLSKRTNLNILIDKIVSSAQK